MELAHQAADADLATAASRFSVGEHSAARRRAPIPLAGLFHLRSASFQFSSKYRPSPSPALNQRESSKAFCTPRRANREKIGDLPRLARTLLLIIWQSTTLFMVSSRIQCRPYFSVPMKLSSVQIEAWQVDELIPWLSWSTAHGEGQAGGSVCLWNRSLQARRRTDR
jgi:hypothetical protein